MALTQLQAAPPFPPEGNRRARAIDTLISPYCAPMTTRHLNVSVTAYGDGSWSVALVQTSVDPGRPLRREQLAVRHLPLEQVERHVSEALAHMIEVEQDRTLPRRVAPLESPG